MMQGSPRAVGLSSVGGHWSATSQGPWSVVLFSDASVPRHSILAHSLPSLFSSLLLLACPSVSASLRGTLALISSFSCSRRRLASSKAFSREKRANILSSIAPSSWSLCPISLSRACRRSCNSRFSTYLCEETVGRDGSRGEECSARGWGNI